MSEPIAEAGFPVTIHTQYVKDQSFENPDAPGSLAPTETPPQVQMVVNVSSRPVGEQLYESTLTLKCEAKAGDRLLYIAELSYCGIFGLPKMAETVLRRFLLAEAPRLLFPYARSIISQMVSDGGFAPLLLQPIDFTKMVEQQDLARQQPTGTA